MVIYHGTIRKQITLNKSMNWLPMQQNDTSPKGRPRYQNISCVTFLAVDIGYTRYRKPTGMTYKAGYIKQVRSRLPGKPCEFVEPLYLEAVEHTPPKRRSKLRKQGQWEGSRMIFCLFHPKSWLKNNLPGPDPNVWVPYMVPLRRVEKLTIQLIGFFKDGALTGRCWLEPSTSPMRNSKSTNISVILLTF